MLSIDLSADGKHRGWIHIPHSTNESGGGRIEIPVISIRNGDGPRVLCLAGVHGDEFEGQIVWTDLAQRLKPEDIRGHMIILPAVNLPSAVAGSRVSPLDGENLNRIFPGASHSGPTARIAHIIETQLIAGSDFMIDLHGGGNSMLFLPAPTITRPEKEADLPELLELLNAFGAPRGYIFDESGGGDGGTLGACRRHGVRRLGTEIGGGGLVSPADLEMMRAGVLRVLTHIGLLHSRMTEDLPEPHAPKILRRRSARTSAYTFTPEPGLFVPHVELGDTVEAGATVGFILWPERPEKRPVEVTARSSGIVIARRRPGRALRGDCLIVLGEEESGANVG